MTEQTLDTLYNEVSVEFSNPFAKIGEFTKAKFKALFKAASESTKDAFRAIDLGHPNGLYRQNTDLQQRIDSKKVQYMDFLPLTVFVPSYLADNVYLVDYMEVLVKQMDLMSRVVANAADNVESIVDGYIGNPSRLNDPNLIMPVGNNYTVANMYREYEELTNQLSKMVVVGGSKSTRTFDKTFARVGDWKQCCIYANNINDAFCYTARNFDRIKKVNSHANDRVRKLVDMVDRNSSYIISAEVGGYLSDLIYRFARLTEFVGASMYAAQVTLKSMTDTSTAIARATR